MLGRSHLEFADLRVELVDLLLLLGRDLRHLTLNLLHYSHLRIRQRHKVNVTFRGCAKMPKILEVSRKLAHREFPNVHRGGPGPARRRVGVVVGHPAAADSSGAAELLGSVQDVGLHHQLLRLLVSLEHGTQYFKFMSMHNSKRVIPRLRELAPAAKRRQEAGFCQPKAHNFSQPCR